MLVAATGFALFLPYRPDPLALPHSLAADSFQQWSRSLHLWASRLLLLLGAAHTGRMWQTRRASGPSRNAYLWGASLLVLLGLSHATGIILRWDPAGQDLAAIEARGLSYLGGADRLLLLQDRTDATLLSAHVPIHAFLLPGLMLGATLIHLAKARGGRLVRAERPMNWFEPRAFLATAAGALLLASLAPAPVSAYIEWPYGAFTAFIQLTGRLGAFVVVALIASAALVAQPFLSRWPGLQSASRYALAALLALSIVRAFF